MWAIISKSDGVCRVKISLFEVDGNDPPFKVKTVKTRWRSTATHAISRPAVGAARLRRRRQ